MTGSGSSSSANGASGGDASGSASLAQYQSLWDLQSKQLDRWVKTVHVLFPKATPKTKDKLSDADQKKLEVSTVLWKNLQKGLTELQPVEEPIKSQDDDDNDGDENSAGQEQASKRQKLNDKSSKKAKQKNKAPSVKMVIKDPFNLWLHTLRRDHDNEDGDNSDDDDDEEEMSGDNLKTSMGGKLSQLSISGILNGMAATPNGLVKNKRLTPVQPELNDKSIVPSLEELKVTFAQLKAVARTFYKALQTKMEKDVLITTPLRIKQMLAPDLLPHEFKSARKRIYDTVVLGKGLAAPADDDDIPTATGGTVHDIEKFKKCKTCQNNDQSLFVLDRKNGDVICSNCGTVASESLMHEGSQFRKFEGEVDRNHHGDAQNPLYSNAHNMSTTLGGVQVTTGAGIGGFGSQKKGLEVVLRNAHAYTELNISQFGKGDRRTRTGYKDKQKKDAFVQMAHCGDALSLHEAVVQRAKELFAGFRDDRELVQQFKGIIAACLCEAFDQLSSAGRRILKQQEEDVALQDESDSKGNRFATSARAHRRNELHHANLAGRGGLLLDFSAVETKVKSGSGNDPAGKANAAAANGASSAVQSKVANKPCSKWDLDDCRTWLLEASRSIATRWMEERAKAAKAQVTSSVPDPDAAKIPKGSKEELEGRLVERAIALCDLLEAESKQKANASTGGMNRGRRAVVTPRVRDMAKLGIKWQHSHERGSGGKGGVGNSGAAKKNAMASAASARRGPTAGQLLILKTSKKLGTMLKDPVAGDAIHKELRTLVGRQDAIKRQQMRDEATRQRLLQMKRKSWLQARVDVQT